MLIRVFDYLNELDKGCDPFHNSMTEKTEKCATCGVLLQEALTGYRRFGDEVKCSDDNFETLGEIVERAPLGIPRVYSGN